MLDAKHPAPGAAERALPPSLPDFRDEAMRRKLECESRAIEVPRGCGAMAATAMPSGSVRGTCRDADRHDPR